MTSTVYNGGEPIARKPDCAVRGQPYYRHSSGYPNTCPIIATYRPKTPDQDPQP